MSNYLKKFLFSVLILMIPYMNSVSKAMDDGDYEGSSVRARKVSFITENQKDVSSSIKQSTSSPVESLEDSKVFWTSYLLSPVKVAIQGTYDVVNFTTQNPRKAMIIGVLLVYQATAVAAQLTMEPGRYCHAVCTNKTLSFCSNLAPNYATCMSENPDIRACKYLSTAKCNLYPRSFECTSTPCTPILP